MRATNKECRASEVKGLERGGAVHPVVICSLLITGDSQLAVLHDLVVKSDPCKQHP